MTGAGGLLGSDVVRVGAEHDVVGLTHADLDVTDGKAVRQRVGDEAPEWVVHCAAYTAVDRAEEESEEALRVNRGGSANVAAAAADAGARMVYFSTDYVFDGRKRTPWLPTDPVAPLSVYGRTKFAGERAAQGAQTLVVRTGWLYGAGGHNFVEAMLTRAEQGESLQVVDDQWGRPTWTRNVAGVTLELMVRGADEGVWHVADRGEATWLELASEAIRLGGVDATVHGVSTKAWGAAAPRPEYSVLDLEATEEYLGRPMMAWREALRAYLSERRRESDG